MRESIQLGAKFLEKNARLIREKDEVRISSMGKVLE